MVLIGQSDFPDRADWDHQLSAESKTDKVSRRIARLRHLEALSAELLVITADVSDRVKMEKAVHHAVNRFGAINGVIHAAGMPDGALIVRQQKETAAGIIDPKVKGALILDHLLRENHLDFFMLCSSLTAITGEPGQIAYTGANAFLDAFSHFRILHRKSPTMTVNWDTWQEVGMAVKSVARYKNRKTRGGKAPSSFSHPLFDALTGEKDNGEVRYISHLDWHRWFLSEHRVMGKALFPGTAFLELAWSAAAHDRGRQEMDLRDIYFSTPLIVAEKEEKTVHTILKNRGELLEFRITSIPASGEEQEHVRGVIGPVLNPPKRHDLKKIEKRCRERQVDSAEDRPGGGRTFLKRILNAPTGPDGGIFKRSIWESGVVWP